MAARGGDGVLAGVTLTPALSRRERGRCRGRPVARRVVLGFGLAAFCGAVWGQGMPPPLAVVTVRVGAADDAGFLHDLADYIARYGFHVTGRPGGPVLDGRAVFLAWFQRDDGIRMLVTDIAAPERMQAFFYGRPDGTAGEVTADLAQAYERKMGSYKAFGPGN